jgi:putative addiction module component (TIGR02574 family)
MSISLHDLEAQVLELPAQDRARLLEQLLASFEPPSSTQQAWLKLAAKRQADVEEGHVALVPGNEALARVRARLR